MPYKTDKKKLGNPLLDRRVKLLPEQKEIVKKLHKDGTAIREITRMFKVSRRTIQFILFPERHLKNLADRKKRGGSKQYYNKDYHSRAMKSHRRYKYATLTGKDNSQFLKTPADKEKQFQNSVNKAEVTERKGKKATRSELKDWYVISNIKRATGLSTSDIKKYPALVEAMRQHMKFRRAVRNKLNPKQ